MCKAKYGNTLLVLHAVLTVAAAVIIVVMSGMPLISLDPETPVNTGISIHMLAYGTLCFLICMWLRLGGCTKSPYWRAFFLSSLFGLLVECVQFWLPYRRFEAEDVMINCLASALVLLPCYALMRYVPLYKRVIREQAVISQSN
jgi:VanZ family protein